jgi:hypothetical protein
VRNTTENTAFKLRGSVLKSVNQKMYVGELFGALAKDFDCVYQETLLIKLHFCAFKEQQQVGSDPI